MNTFHFDETTVFGSQTPFYFSMSVTDFYSMTAPVRGADHSEGYVFFSDAAD